MAGLSKAGREKVRQLKTDDKVNFHISFSRTHFDFISDLAERQFAMKVEIIRRMIAEVYAEDNFEMISSVSGSRVEESHDVHKMKLTLPESLDDYLGDLSERYMLSKTSVLRQIVNYHYQMTSQRSVKNQ